MAKKLYIKTFGCQMNEYDSAKMADVLAAADGYEQTSDPSEADLIRFEREVRITAELEHPSIVPIHDIGIDDVGRPYYVMRRIRGKPLSDRITKLRDLSAQLFILFEAGGKAPFELNGRRALIEIAP